MGLINRQDSFNGLPAFAAVCNNNGTSNPGEGGNAASGAVGTVLTAKELIEFIQVFSSTLLGAGGQTTRVDRTACRIARAYGFEVELAIFPKHLMLSVIKPAEGGHSCGTAYCGELHCFGCAKLSAGSRAQRLELEHSRRGPQS